MMPQISLGSSFPGKSPMDALAHLRSGFQDPLLGPIGFARAQICPQNYGAGPITHAMLEDLQIAFPETQFRFHANVRLLDKGCQYDLGTAQKYPEYTDFLVPLLRYLGEPYSLHAANNGMPLKRQFQLAKWLTDRAGVPVGIEGLYPSRRTNTLASWKAYESLLAADVFFAIDVSHLNIVRQVEGPGPDGLVESLLENPRCMEVHLSGNDGLSDRHLPCSGDEWWAPYMDRIHMDWWKACSKTPAVWKCIFQGMTGYLTVICPVVVTNGGLLTWTESILTR